MRKIIGLICLLLFLPIVQAEVTTMDYGSFWRVIYDYGKLPIDFQISKSVSETEANEVMQDVLNRIYCTTLEHDRLLTTSNLKGCYISTGYSESYGGLIKLGGEYINLHWLEKQEYP